MVPDNLAVNSLVWVEDLEIAWIDGVIVEINGDDITVNCTNGKQVVVNAANVYAKDVETPSCGVDDMTKLAYLHEPGVLQNLQCRYNINEIYTYTGSILIAVNPFQKLPQLYDGDMMERYKGALLGELNPHPFAVADAAYRMMINEGVSQSILVSGESGAGKTESTKSLMRYLAYMGGRTQTGARTVEQQVLESNPVLEAFGNAKTVRNNNSSRFGKFVEIQFDQSGRISGAAVRTYLLERTRICQVSDPERNYHCFYMLCAAPAEDIERYKLGNPRMFHYLNQSNCYELDGMDDANGYLETRRAMDIVGINSTEQDAIFRIVAAILHLGNIEFVKGKDADSSEPGDSDSRFHLQMTAELLMCDEMALEDSLCKRVILTRDETITKSLDPSAATVSRDALAKIVYSRLFDWIVCKINSSIGQDPDSKFLIGVLDIYGFESFQSNSFEQFCINLTNEKLQQHFNQHVFKMEQEEYTREEINWSYIDFVDNRDVLDLIEKKPGGIIALLDEACMFPRSTHDTFAQKLYQTFSTHTRFSKPKLSRSDFTICHYAGEVTYQTEFFLDKNKDYVVAEHQSLLGASRCPFVSNLFPSLHEDSTKTSKFSSIGSRFKQQLVALLETLNATNPHYIRCIKPNSFLKPAIFENSNVLQQLKCGGVMEAVRISCAGYPTRRSFDEFVGRFAILDPAVLNGSLDEITASRRILDKAKLTNFQIGKSKVFLRAGQMAELDARRNEVLMRSAGVIQRKIRSYLGRKTFILLRRSATKIQAACRGVVGRRLFESVRVEAACIMIQKCMRMHLTMKTHQMICFAAFIVQTGVRGMAARRELSFRRRSEAAVIIQCYSRRFLARVEYARFMKAMIVVQCAWRARVSRRELRKLRMDARETGALKEAKNKLEKQVKDLTLLLEMEKSIRVDVEEERKQETSRLQSKLDAALQEVGETKTLLIKEREAVKAAIEETNVVREALELEHEREKLKVDVEEERKQETSRLLSKLDAALHEVGETKTLLIKEREAVKAAIEETNVVREALELEHEREMLKVAGETDSLKEVNSKLEDKVGQLNLLLQSEKSSRAGFEEIEAEEMSKIRATLEERELQLFEAKRLLAKECDVVNHKNSDSGQIYVMEGPFVANEAMHNLSFENEELKTLVSSLERKIDETEKKYEESTKLNDVHMKQALDAENKIIQLKMDMQRLEEKLSDFEVVDEPSTPQHISMGPPVGTEWGHVGFPTQPLENGHLDLQSATPRESESKLQRLHTQCHHEAVGSLLKCVSRELGFEHGKPVAAFTIYRCLLQWKSFEAEKTSVFDRIVQLIGSAIEDQDNNAHLAYWLSNTSALLFLLQGSLKSMVTSGSIRKPPNPTSLFGRMAQGFRSSASSSNLSTYVLQHVVARYPALLFKQQLAAYIEKMCGIIRDNLKKDLASTLTSCIRTSKTPRANVLQSPSDPFSSDTSTCSWKRVTESLSGLRNMLNENFVPPVFVQKILNQSFSYINAQLFNSLLIRQECCTFSNGEYVKAGLDELELWCNHDKDEYGASCWGELKHLRQAVGFLVIHQKSRIFYEDIANDLCSVLSVRQIYRICTLYWDDIYNTSSVSPDVVSNLKALVGVGEDEDGVADNNSFLLDDNSSHPFSVDEVPNSEQEIDFSGVRPAEELLHNPAFRFLKDQG